MTQESISLKWGGVKGWSNLTDASRELLQSYFADGVPLSAMTDNPNAKRKAILCELIDQFTGEIWDDWNERKMSKEEAKTYINEYLLA
jgi:hypothetical protein